MLNFYNQIKKFYEQGLYTEEQLEVFVKAGMLTNEQKEDIINGDSAIN